MHRLPAFPSSRIVHPCMRAIFPIRTSQVARTLAPATTTTARIQTGLPRTGSACGLYWGNVERRRWTTVRPFASMRETEKPEELGEAVEMYKEVGLAEEKGENDAPMKPDMCTADELHYVPVPGTAWRLALWRYLPVKNSTKRKHPVLMLSGIATNAYCFDLAPDVSLARYLADAGFDTWILEVRGAGLSKREGEPTAVQLGGVDGAMTEAAQDTVVEAAIERATKATPHMEKHIEERHVEKGDTPVTASPTDSGDSSSNGSSATSSSLGSDRPAATDENVGASENASEKAEVARVDKKLRELKKENPKSSWLTSVVSRLTERYKLLVRACDLLLRKFVNKVISFFEGGHLKSRVGRLQDGVQSFLDGKKTSEALSAQLSSATKRVGILLEKGQRSVSPTVSNWQGRLNSTVGSVQEVIDLISKYDWDFDNYLEEDVPAAMEYVRSHTDCPDGKVFGLGHSMGGIILYAMLGTRAEHGLKAAVTVASSLEYGMSDSTLKLLVPFASPAQLLNIPVVPLGLMMSAVTPLITKGPYPLAWIGYHVSAKGMMDVELFQKLILTNFCTIPMALLHQLKSVFDSGGLRNRDGSVCYKELLKDCDIPVMAIAGDRDLICPPSAVIDTAKVFPNGATYKEFGNQERHYSHYDLLCGRKAKNEVYPELRDFLVKNDD